jgi:transposase
MNRTGYPSDVSDEEWAFAAPYLTLMSETAAQRDHSLREVFNGLRWLIRTGAPWRMLPHDLPPWATVYQQTQRWWRAGVFEAMVSDRRAILRLAAGRNASPSAAIIDSRTLQSSPESGARAGYDGAKRKRACTTHPRSVSGPCDRVFQPIPLAGIGQRAQQCRKAGNQSLPFCFAGRHAFQQRDGSLKSGCKPVVTIGFELRRHVFR